MKSTKRSSGFNAFAARSRDFEARQHLFRTEDAAERYSRLREFEREIDERARALNAKEKTLCAMEKAQNVRATDLAKLEKSVGDLSARAKQLVQAEKKHLKVVNRSAFHSGIKGQVVTALALRGVTLDEARGTSRRRHIVHARRAVMALLHDHGWSTTGIGKFLNRDHSTVVHALKKARLNAGGA